MSTPTINFGCFYQSLPMRAAQHHGFYDEAGVAVEYQQVTSSTQQFQALRDGEYDMVQTSPDNTANYRFNQDNPLGTTIDGKGFMGMDYGMQLAVVARPEFTSLEDLAGQVISVDAETSGFAFVIYEILASAGLERGRDYEIVSTGGVFHRFQAMMAGDDFAATLLSGGFEVRAANAGFNLLDQVTDIIDPYLGVWAAATDTWLAEHHDVGARLVSAYRDATAWCFDPANRDACLDLLVEMPDTDRDLAAQLYDVQVRPGVGNVPDAGIDPEAAANVLQLRADHDGFEDDVDVTAVVGPDGELVDRSLLAG